MCVVYATGVKKITFQTNFVLQLHVNMPAVKETLVINPFNEAGLAHALYIDKEIGYPFE